LGLVGEGLVGEGHGGYSLLGDGGILLGDGGGIDPPTGGKPSKEQGETEQI
jgi:hypothetical protein